MYVVERKRYIYVCLHLATEPPSSCQPLLQIPSRCRRLACLLTVVPAAANPQGGGNKAEKEKEGHGGKERKKNKVRM